MVNNCEGTFLFRYATRPTPSKASQGVKREFFYATNPDYCFALQRFTPPGDTRLGYIGQDTELVKSRMHLKEVLDPSLDLCGYRLDELAANPAFQIVEAETITRDGREMVRIGFKAGYKYKKQQQIDDGWVILDPARLWSIQECEVFLNDRVVSIHTAIDYSYVVLGIPIPSAPRTRTGFQGA